MPILANSTFIANCKLNSSLFIHVRTCYRVPIESMPRKYRSSLQFRSRYSSSLEQKNLHYLKVLLSSQTLYIYTFVTNSSHMAGKRQATSNINRDNWDHVEEPEERGTFKTAPPEELKTRVIKKATRRKAGVGGSEADEAATDSPSSSVFSGFSGTTDYIIII